MAGLFQEFPVMVADNEEASEARAGGSGMGMGLCDEPEETDRRQALENTGLHDEEAGAHAQGSPGPRIDSGGILASLFLAFWLGFHGCWRSGEMTPASAAYTCVLPLAN